MDFYSMPSVIPASENCEKAFYSEKAFYLSWSICSHYVHYFDYYFTNLVWANGQTVSVTWMNREQTTSVVMLCKADSGDCIENYKEVVDNGWVNQG
ncbi:Inactive dipeptidyl peptidase 10, partial [Paramuricea clavata]